MLHGYNNYYYLWCGYAAELYVYRKEDRFLILFKLKSSEWNATLDLSVCHIYVGIHMHTRTHMGSGFSLLCRWYEDDRNLFMYQMFETWGVPIASATWWQQCAIFREGSQNYCSSLLWLFQHKRNINFILEHDIHAQGKGFIMDASRTAVQKT